MKTVDIYTDGSCKCNPGPGGWGAVNRYGGKLPMMGKLPLNFAVAS